jgi:hypothetical protein
MEKLPQLPRSLTHIRKIKAISPASVRVLKQVISTRNASKFINLNSTMQTANTRPASEGLELSFQLTTLRKNLDKHYLSKFYKEKMLEDLKLELKQLQDSEIVKEAELSKLKFYEQLKNDLKETKYLKLQELENQKILDNMHERMRKTKVFLEKKDKKVKKILEINTYNAEMQAKLMKETLDSVSQYKIVYKSALESLKFEVNSLTTEISRMKAQSKLKKSLITKTEEYNKNRIDIVEKTMIDERSSHLEEMRNSLISHKMYDKLLSKKLVIVKNIFNRLDEAFQKVRIKTGLFNAEEVIVKFLTQEANYQALTQTLHAKELECNEYKKKIDDIQEKVAVLDEDKPSKEYATEEIKQKINEIGRSKEKKSEIWKIFLKINIWVDNIIKKIDPVVSEEEIKALNLSQKFKLLKGLVSNILNDPASSRSIKVEFEAHNKLKIEDIHNFYQKYKTKTLKVEGNPATTLKLRATP